MITLINCSYRFTNFFALDIFSFHVKFISNNTPKKTVSLILYYYYLSDGSLVDNNIQVRRITFFTRVEIP